MTCFSREAMEEDIVPLMENWEKQEATGFTHKQEVQTQIQEQEESMDASADRKQKEALLSGSYFFSEIKDKLTC